MVAIAEDKFHLYQLSAGSTPVTDLCRRGILLFLYIGAAKKPRRRGLSEDLTDVIIVFVTLQD